MSAQPAEQRYIDVSFRGQKYRITVDHAHMLNLRGHLRSRQSSYRGAVHYWVEDDRHICVTGDPLPAEPSGGTDGNH